MTIDPICFSCKHKRPGGLTCAAFPEEIPDAILYGDDDHKQPLPEQGNDITFEPVKEEPAR